MNNEKITFNLAEAEYLYFEKKWSAKKIAALYGFKTHKSVLDKLSVLGMRNICRNINSSMEYELYSAQKYNIEILMNAIYQGNIECIRLSVGKIGERIYLVFPI